MVSIAQTAKKYHGRKAATYDEIREKQERWAVENNVVARWLHELRPSSVLDCPVGTGRFMGLYLDLLSLNVVQGIDVSDEMLALARKKLPRKTATIVDLRVGDATALDLGDESHDVAVCVRFLDLIDEEAMCKVVKELCRVARRAVILTIRLGETYRPKSNTAEHDRKKFTVLISRLGWGVYERVPFRDAGWEIMRLERRT